MKLKMKDMKIRKRLTMAFSMVLAIFIVVSVIIGSAMLYMINQYDYTLVHYAFPQGDIGRLMNATAEVRSATRGIVGYETDELINIAKEQHEEAKEQVALYMEEVRPTMVTGEGKACMEAIDAAWKAYEAKDEEIVALGGTTDAAASEKAQRMMHTDLAPLYTALDDAIVNLMDVNVAKGDSSWEKLRIIEFCIIAAFVITIVVAIIIAVRIVKLIAESIEKPLKQTCERLATFAQGDLDSPFPEIDTKDEISEMIIEAREMSDRLRNIVIDASRLLGEMANGNFNIATEYEEQYVGSFRDLLMGMRNMNRQMNAALVEVDEASKQVSSGSTNMSEAAQALAEGATDQAASVEEIQATITDLTEGIQTTAEQLRAAYSEAQRCAQVAENSRTDMDALTQAMDRISETSQKIGNIISEIEDIASQTNLLSLNASIEAARAGEAGRGFAVVADQIRNLAEQSAQSAVDSRALIEGALHEIEEGNRVATNAANSLHEVVSSVESIAETSRDLSDISAEQARAMGQADAGVNRISEVVQSNSATAEESSATSEELTAQAICMSELVSKFTFRS